MNIQHGMKEDKAISLINVQYGNKEAMNKYLYEGILKRIIKVGRENTQLTASPYIVIG